MKCLLLLLLLLLPTTVWAQNTAGTARRIQWQATAPTTCQPSFGDVYWNTTTKVMYGCTAANTWSAIGYTGNLNGVINVKDAAYGAVGDGVTNDAAAFQAAFDAANAAHKEVVIPGGDYKINTTLTGYSYLHIRGYGGQVNLKPGMTDDSPVLDFPNGTAMWSVENINITSNINLTNFLAGTAEAQDAIGIRAGSGGDSTDFVIRNVYVKGFEVGYTIKGWRGSFYNASASYCETGFIGDDLNDTELGFRFGANRKDYAITDSSGVHFVRLLQEDGAASPASSTIDNSFGIVFSAPYWEVGLVGRSVPLLTIGGTTECRQIEIRGGLMDHSVMARYVVPLALDKVDGADINIYWNEGGQLRTVSTTANTKNLTLNGSQDHWQHDTSKQLGVSQNYFANGSFEMWLRGWSNIYPANAVISKDTTIVRKGVNALRITASAATANNKAQFTITGSAVTALRSKTVRVGAWIWVPNTDDFIESPRVRKPTIRLGSDNGATTWSAVTDWESAAKGEWNYITDKVAVLSDATSIIIAFFLDGSGTNCAGTEYVVVDDVSLVEDSVPYAKQLNGVYVDSPMIAAIGVSGKMISYSSAVPTDTDQVYEVGDTVYNSAAAAGQPSGWVCTVAGSPGTWMAISYSSNLGPTSSPATTDACTAGSVTWDASYAYVCTASGAWKKISYLETAPYALTEATDAIIMNGNLASDFTVTMADDADGATLTVINCAPTGRRLHLMVNNAAAEVMTYGAGITVVDGSTVNPLSDDPPTPISASGETDLIFRCTSGTGAKLISIYRDAEP